MTYIQFFLLIVSAVISSNIWADSKETEQQLDSVKTEINAINQDLIKNKHSKSTLYTQLKKQSRIVSSLNKELLSIKKKVSNRKKEIAKLEQQVAKQNQSHSQQLAALNAQIRHAFINGKPSAIKVLLNQQSPTTLARSSRYFHYYHQARQQQLKQISSLLANLSDDQRQLYTAQKKQLQFYKQQTLKQKQLHTLTQLRQATLKQLEGKINDQGSQLSVLYEQEQSLKKLLASLKKPKAEASSISPVKGRSFAKRAGTLPWPLKGKVIARYGSSRNIGKLTWQGILISSPAGEDIVSTATGQIIFADWLRGFGLLIIIDHGDQYMSLYGNNETLLKQVGDIVSAGELIAQSGDKGVRQHAGLYFEIRHKGSPTNPLKWLSKQG
ncbi:peptidoglycan DD-metalloendopeptidase family protein [Pseudomonadota bacterium]|nr:peptidoglycan DD-metalloendopeptidase family protein [Pseudomonadota bacterium]